jgi:hypothetical protein
MQHSTLFVQPWVAGNSPGSSLSVSECSIFSAPSIFNKKALGRPAHMDSARAGTSFSP